MVLLPFQSLPLRLFAVAQQDDMPHKQLCSRTRYLLPEAKISQVGLAKSRSCDTVPRQRAWQETITRQASLENTRKIVQLSTQCKS